MAALSEEDETVRQYVAFNTVEGEIVINPVEAIRGYLDNQYIYVPFNEDDATDSVIFLQTKRV